MTEALELELEPGVSDGDLARAAAEGDRQAFAEIYDRYADRLYDFCVGLIGDRDAAADCVQDAFCVAATDLARLREPDKLRPWLYSIARHHAMRRLRHRYREEVSDELPDMVSHEASPETLAGQSELARLVAEAAGGLSDRDRELLDLSYRHGLDGPELAEALGVTLTNANTMMSRLRQTVERCLGALLVARGAQANPLACPELAAILKGWDGQFTVLMRKRMARHIDSCQTCEQDQRRHVNPVALLGSAPAFIPAPSWLRRQTLDRVQLTCAGSDMSEASGHSASSSLTEASGQASVSQRIGKRRTALIIGFPLLCLILSITWFARPEDPVSKVVDTGADSSEGPLPVLPAAIKGSPTPVLPRPVPPVGTARPAVPTQRAEATATPGATTPGSPSAAPGANNSGPKPPIMLPIPGPTTAPLPPQIVAPAVANSDQAGPNVVPPIDTAPVNTGPDKPVYTPPAEDPKVAKTGPGYTAPGYTGSIPNLNLDPKVVTSYPKNGTGTITNPNATTPKPQIGGAPKLNTNLGSAPKVDTNPGTTPKANTSSTNPKTTNTTK